MLKRKAAQQLDDIDQVPPKRHHGTFATAVDEGASTEAVTSTVSSITDISLPGIKVNPLAGDSPSKVSDNSVATDNKSEELNGSEADVDEMASTNSHNSAHDSRILEFDSSDDDIEAGENRWLPAAGPMSWVQRQMQEGKDPRQILTQLLPSGAELPDGLHEVMLWKIIVSILSEPPARKKLVTQNTLEDFLHLMSNCRNIMVLTGAGVSVSCGIPDFRSRDGLYARLAVEYPDLPDPQAMFDINYFKGNPYPFFKFAKEIYPGKFNPSPSHRFIKMLEAKGKLLRNYTQNIDTLEQVAGIKNIVQCHGSFATATCMVCKHKVTSSEVKEEIMQQSLPKCRVCPADSEASIIKPDIVFFGENLPEEFHEQMAEDKTVCDLLIVIGSSLKVRPVSLIPSSLPASIPQVLINREPLPHQTFDIELLGDCDVIVDELARRLDWSNGLSTTAPLRQIGVDDLKPIEMPKIEIKIDDMFSRRSPPPEVMIDQSVSSLDVDSSCQLSLRGDYLNPLEGSQLSSIGHLKMSTSTVDQMSKDSMSLDQPVRASGSQAVSLPLVQSDGSSSQEHSFTGKLAQAPRDPDDILPTSSNDRVEVIKRNISARLPESSFLFLEPNRYVFSGAELFSDEENDSDNEDDANSSLSSNSGESVHVDESMEPTPRSSDADIASSDNDVDHYSRRLFNASQVRRAAERPITHDEDAFDAFPTPSGGIQEEQASSDTLELTGSRKSFSDSHTFGADSVQ